MKFFPVGNRCNKDGITRYISSIIHHFSSSDDCNFLLYVVASVRWLRQPPNNSKNVPKLTHQLTICTWPYPATQETKFNENQFSKKKKIVPVMGVKWMPIGRIECRRLSNSLQRSTVTLAKKKKSLLSPQKNWKLLEKFRHSTVFFSHC